MTLADGIESPLLFPEVPPEWADFCIYNALDSAVLPEILNAQLGGLAQQENISHYERTRDVLPALTYMQLRGIRMDTALMEQKAEEKLQEMLEARAAFFAETGVPVNLASPTQLANYFYKELGTKPIKNPEGGVTADDDAMKELIIRGIKAAEHVQDFRKAGKLRGTYYLMPLSPDGRMHCQFKPVGTKTARLSSAQSFFGYGTNMQNQPYDLKFCCLADPGYLIFEMDLSQAENRICAWAGPVPEMIECFENGEDIHSKTAALVLSIITGERRTPESVNTEKGSAPFGNRLWSERDMGKRSNHALNWGMGWYEASRQWECPAAVTKRIIEAYHFGYPGVRRGYHPFIQSMLKDEKTTTNPFGRRRRFLLPTWGERQNDLFKEAYADYAQSTVGCIINERGLTHVMNNPFTYGPLELLNQVHDSIWFQIPVSVGYERMASMVTQLKESLEQPFQIRGREIVIPADVKAGHNMGEAKEVDCEGNLALALQEIYEEGP